MPDLSFQVAGVEAVAASAAPMLAFKLAIANAGGEQIHSILLRAQIQIEVTRRRYNAQEQERLFDLFGPPPEWSRTLRRMLWAQVSLNVPGFNTSTIVDLLVPCSYDLQIAVTRYLHALEQGEVPIRLLFSGTVLYSAERPGLQVAQIPWEKEATHRMPAQVWKAMMDRFYPNAAWLCLSRELIDRLSEYKTRSGLATWDQVIRNLLPSMEKVDA